MSRTDDARTVADPTEPPDFLADDPLLADLTAPQRQAVLHTEGPLLVLAAAGSGKTRVITRRVAHLIGCGIAPWSILALTFTNKAAGEMRARVESQLCQRGDERSMRGLTITTFHSLCARLLRRFAEEADLPGLRPDYTIYDADDQQALIKRVIKDLSLSTSNWPPGSVRSKIGSAKHRLLDSEAFAARAGDFYSKQIARIYSGYERALHAAGALDFDDLLMLTARMLSERESIRRSCRDRWDYLLIDEYQDTNHAQFMIASLLAGEARDTALETHAAGPNICVVGDPDQSIYGWRGADISNILDFEQAYPATRVITLGENFRSTGPILTVADTLIRHNKRRKHKDLFTSRDGGEPVRVVRCADERHEAEVVRQWLAGLHENGDLSWREMAVFYRTNALSRVVEDEMRLAGVPYIVARGTSFYQREEVRNALAYLRVVANRADDVSLARIIGVPPRGIGSTTFARVQALAAERGLSLFGALREASGGGVVSPRASKAIGTFVALIESFTGDGQLAGVEVDGSLARLVERVIRESGLEAMYARRAQIARVEAEKERPDNLAELVSSAAQFEADYDPDADPALFEPPDEPADSSARSGAPGGDSPDEVEQEGADAEPRPVPLLALLRAYLESVSLVADTDALDSDQGAVTLMTLHAAKGLEFSAVAMIGLEEACSPTSGRAIRRPRSRRSVGSASSGSRGPNTT